VNRRTEHFGEDAAQYVVHDAVLEDEVEHVHVTIPLGAVVLRVLRILQEEGELKVIHLHVVDHSGYEHETPVHLVVECVRSVASVVDIALPHGAAGEGDWRRVRRRPQGLVILAEVVRKEIHWSDTPAARAVPISIDPFSFPFKKLKK
jgi:hypothetical protein